MILENVKKLLILLMLCGFISIANAHVITNTTTEYSISYCFSPELGAGDVAFFDDVEIPYQVYSCYTAGNLESGSTHTFVIENKTDRVIYTHVATTDGLSDRRVWGLIAAIGLMALICYLAYYQMIFGYIGFAVGMFFITCEIRNSTPESYIVLTFMLLTIASLVAGFLGRENK